MIGNSGRTDRSITLEVKHLKENNYMRRKMQSQSGRYQEPPFDYLQAAVGKPVSTLGCVHCSYDPKGK